MPTDRGLTVANNRVQHHQQTTRQQLRRWSDLGHEALGEQDAERLHAILDARLLPHVAADATLLRAAEKVSRQQGLPFDTGSLAQYLRARHGDSAAELTVDPEAEDVEASLSDVDVETDRVPVSAETLYTAFRTVYAVLAAGGIVRSAADSAAPAIEYQHQVGERYYRALSAGGGRVEMIDPDDDLKATLCTGGQGSGKSTAVETMVEDRIAHGHKVIDLLDFQKTENVMYDVPSESDELRAAREDMGLSPSLADADYEVPNMEVRVPLTRNHDDVEVPYDTGRDEWVVKPFVVPASELTYRQLVMVLPHTTTTQENYLQSAYQQLDESGKDWTLSDMAETIRYETDAGDSVADRIEQNLKRAQAKSFIRDQESPDDYLIDWNDMMLDTSTVTAFTFWKVGGSSDKKMLASFLLDQLYDARNSLVEDFKLHDYPPVTTVIRELHNIIPRNKSEQDSEKTIEGYMTDTMAELIALCRHANLELICDTQKFKQQLHPTVSSMFHRVFAFGGQRPDIQEVFKTRVATTHPAEKVAGYNNGMCALVSGDGYTMPIQFAPPRCHHLDARTDGNGLGFRVRHDDLDEELRDPDWPTDVPTRLLFGEETSSPIARFVDDCLGRNDADGAFVLKEDITDAYNEWAAEHDEPSKSHRALHRWLGSNLELDSGKTTRHDSGGGQKPCYWQVRLTA